MWAYWCLSGINGISQTSSRRSCKPQPSRRREATRTAVVRSLRLVIRLRFRATRRLRCLCARPVRAVVII